MINLDPWQQEILQTTGNILLCSGRQVGKSTIISMSASEYAVKNSKKSILIISATERQAEELFIKCLNFITDNYKGFIKKGKDRPTKHILKLTNGSVIRSLPTGLAGTGIRGFTIDRLIADEAAYIEDAVFYSLTPSLLTTGGDIILVSTPRGKKGFFWEMTKDPTFKVFNVNSESVIKDRVISSSWTEKQRDDALNLVEREKKRMSKRVFLQEYCGNFTDESSDYFSDALIKKVCCLRPGIDTTGKKTVLGVDIARLGDDLSSFTILTLDTDKIVKQVEQINTSKTRLNETFEKIKELDNKYKFKCINFDGGGIGSGVGDYLLADPKLQDKSFDLNNRSKAPDDDDAKRKKIFKESLYNNLLMMMERGEIQLLADDEIVFSLQSVKYEYVVTESQETKLRIFTSPHTDIIEAVTRAAWGYKDKHLNIWVGYTGHGV